MTTDLDVVFVHPDGTCESGAIRIGQPYLVNGQARCSIQLLGLQKGRSVVAGRDSLQALALAVRVTGRMLAWFVESGGKILDRERGEPIRLDTYFGTATDTPPVRATRSEGAKRADWWQERARVILAPVAATG